MAQDRFNNIAASSTPGVILGRLAGVRHTPLLFLGLLAVALLLTSLLTPTPVRADPGVAMTSGNIIVDDELSRGRTYHLPAITVANAGDEPGKFVMVLTYQLGGKYRPLPTEWITFEPQHFLLDPDRSQEVALTLSIPTEGFRHGDFFVFIESHQVSETTGEIVGSAIATRLAFTVPASGWVLASTEWARTFAGNHSVWGYIIVALLLGPVLLYLLRRFIRISIAVGRNQ